jgi:hypothetical protein
VQLLVSIGLPQSVSLLMWSSSDPREATTRRIGPRDNARKGLHVAEVLLSTFRLRQHGISHVVRQHLRVHIICVESQKRAGRNTRRLNPLSSCAVIRTSITMTGLIDACTLSRPKRLCCLGLGAALMLPLHSAKEGSTHNPLTPAPLDFLERWSKWSGPTESNWSHRLLWTTGSRIKRLK